MTTDRRKFMAGASAVALTGVLAGCVEEDGDSGEEDDTGVTLQPPELRYNTDQLDEPYRFIVESLHYQNQMLAKEDE